MINPHPQASDTMIIKTFFAHSIYKEIYIYIHIYKRYKTLQPFYYIRKGITLHFVTRKLDFMWQLSNSVLKLLLPANKFTAFPFCTAVWTYWTEVNIPQPHTFADCLICCHCQVGLSWYICPLAEASHESSTATYGNHFADKCLALMARNFITHMWVLYNWSYQC